MSRYVIALEDGEEVCYGFDHSVGYFFQRFDREGVIVCDLDSMFGGLTGGRLLELLADYDVPEHHRAAIALDLPF